LLILNRNKHSGPGEGNKLPATSKFYTKKAPKSQRSCYLFLKIFCFLLENEHEIECLIFFINDPCSHCPINNCSPVLEAHAPEMRNEVKLMLPQYSPDDSLGNCFFIPGNKVYRLFLTAWIAVVPNPV
jgi:hypothetical protein